MCWHLFTPPSPLSSWQAILLSKKEDALVVAFATRAIEEDSFRVRERCISKDVKVLLYFSNYSIYIYFFNYSYLSRISYYCYYEIFSSVKMTRQTISVRKIVPKKEREGLK